LKKFLKKKIVKFILKAIVTAGFTVWIILKTNWAEMWMYLKEIRAWHIVLYVAILVLGMIICSYRWKKLAEFKGIKLPLWDFFKYYLTGTFINNFMPSFVAGDAYKAYAIASPEKSYSEAGSTVVMDRITGVIGLMVLALIFSLLNFKFMIGNKLLVILNLLIIFSLCSDVIIARMKKIAWLRKLVFRFAPEKIINFLQEVYNYGNNSKILINSISWSIIFSIVGVALLNYILFWALGIKVGIINYLSVIFLISIVAALPISINNIGLKEWAYITFFGFFGVSTGAAVAISVISRFLQMAVSFTAVPMYLKRKK
jgi:glycosyltransferase 2 family protein